MFSQYALAHTEESYKKQICKTYHITSESA